MVDNKTKKYRPRYDMYDVKLSLRAIQKHVETSAILYHLFEARGNVSIAAKTLGISRQGLYDKAKRYEIDLNMYDKMSIKVQK